MFDKPDARETEQALEALADEHQVVNPNGKGGQQVREHGFDWYMDAAKMISR
jgi:hypothetical protein